MNTTPENLNDQVTEDCAASSHGVAGSAHESAKPSRVADADSGAPTSPPNEKARLAPGLVRPDSRGKSTERLYAPERAPFGDALSEKGSLRRDLERDGLIGDNSDRPIFFAPWVNTATFNAARMEAKGYPCPPRLDGYDGWDFQLVVSEQSLARQQMYRTNKGAIAAGYRPLDDPRKQLLLHVSLIRYLVRSGKLRSRPTSGLRWLFIECARLKHEVWLDDVARAIVERLRESKQERRERLRDDIRADREAGLSLRKIGQMRDIPKSTVSDLLSKNPDT